jgi:hypothetical protein
MFRPGNIRSMQVRFQVLCCVARTALAIHECADDVAQRAERQVDLGGLLQPVTWQQQQQQSGYTAFMTQGRCQLRVCRVLSDSQLLQETSK